MNCCEKCQIYWTCETKWYRSERAEENTCCNVCNFHSECEKELQEKSKKTSNV